MGEVVPLLSIPPQTVPVIPGAINIPSGGLNGNEIVGIGILSPETAQTTIAAIADYAKSSNPGGIPMAGNSAVIVTGGQAVQLVIGPCSGGYITNPPNAASQAIADAENCYVDPVSAPGHTDADGNDTTSILFPGSQFLIPRLAIGASIWGNAATSGHKLTVVVYP